MLKLNLQWVFRSEAFRGCLEYAGGALISRISALIKERPQGAPLSLSTYKDTVRKWPSTNTEVDLTRHQIYCDLILDVYTVTL
jgi:hypothetical protein